MHVLVRFFALATLGKTICDMEFIRRQKPHHTLSHTHTHTRPMMVPSPNGVATDPQTVHGLSVFISQRFVEARRATAF